MSSSSATASGHPSSPIIRTSSDPSSATTPTVMMMPEDSEEIFLEAPTMPSQPSTDHQTAALQSAATMMGQRVPSMGTSINDFGPSLAGRIRCTAFRSFRFRGLALLQRCGAPQLADDNNVAAATSAAETEGPAARALASVLAETKEAEERSMKLYVLVHFLDRFHGYLNVFKQGVIAGWSREQQEQCGGNDNAQNQGTKKDKENDDDPLKDAVAEWPIAHEHDLAIEFSQGVSTWLPQLLVTTCGGALHRGPHGGICIVDADATNSTNLDNSGGEHQEKKQKPLIFWTYETLKQKRSQVIQMINHRDAFRFDEVCELVGMITVGIIRNLIPDSLPNRGENLNAIQIVPRGKRHDNLFVGYEVEPYSSSSSTSAEEQEQPDSTLLDLDCAFHTSSSELMILFPSVWDLTQAHYARLKQRTEKVRNSGGPPMAERVPFLTFVPRFFATMTHESTHVVQGICNHADPSRFKMPSEHDPSVNEESLGYIIAKRYCGDSLLGHLFPPGAAAMSPMERMEKCHNHIYQRLGKKEKKKTNQQKNDDDGKVEKSEEEDEEHVADLIAEYEKFLMSFGTYKVKSIEEGASAHFDDEDSAWSQANVMAYNQMPHFSKSEDEIAELLRLIFHDRWDCNLRDVPRGKELEAVIATKKVSCPVANFRKLIVPEKDAAEKIRRAFSL